MIREIIDAIFWCTGLFFWVVLAVAAIFMYCEYMNKQGRFLISIFGFGMVIIKHQGNETLVDRMLEIGYRIHKVRSRWLGFQVPRWLSFRR